MSTCIDVLMRAVKSTLQTCEKGSSVEACVPRLTRLRAKGSLCRTLPEWFCAVSLTRWYIPYTVRQHASVESSYLIVKERKIECVAACTGSHLIDSLASHIARGG